MSIILVLNIHTFKDRNKPYPDPATPNVACSFRISSSSSNTSLLQVKTLDLPEFVRSFMVRRNTFHIVMFLSYPIKNKNNLNHCMAYIFALTQDINNNMY